MEKEEINLFRLIHSYTDIFFYLISVTLIGASNYFYIYSKPTFFTYLVYFISFGITFFGGLFYIFRKTYSEYKNFKLFILYSFLISPAIAYQKYWGVFFIITFLGYALGIFLLDFLICKKRFKNIYPQFKEETLLSLQKSRKERDRESFYRLLYILLYFFSYVFISKIIYELTKGNLFLYYRTIFIILGIFMGLLLGLNILSYFSERAENKSKKLIIDNFTKLLICQEIYLGVIWSIVYLLK